MTERLQPILALLDEGVAIYRRNFAGFMLISALWFVPVAIATGVLIAVASLIDTGAAFLLGLLGLLLLFPLAIYLVGGLSRAAAAAIDGRPLRFREALAIGPRARRRDGLLYAGLTCCSPRSPHMISMVIICPLYLVGLVLVGGLSLAGTGCQRPRICSRE